MKYYYELWFELKGVNDRSYKRLLTSSKVLTLDFIKNDTAKYTKLRKNLCLEIGLDERSYEDLELFAVVNTGYWRGY